MPPTASIITIVICALLLYLLLKIIKLPIKLLFKLLLNMLSGLALLFVFNFIGGHERRVRRFCFFKTGSSGSPRASRRGRRRP